MTYNITFKTCVILAMFIIGLLFTSTYTSKNVKEAFEGNSSMPVKNRCPNVLIQKGSELYLHNNRLATVPGVNPLKFNNLEEYVEFMEWQRGQGIRCPVLYLQQTFDAQGNPVYKIRPNPLEPQGGLPPVAEPGAVSVSSKTNYIDQADTPPKNANSYPPFDPMEPKAAYPRENIQNLRGVSANPMDPNWGGDSYTQSLINAGKYKGNEVAIRLS